MDARGLLVESFLTSADMLFLNAGLPTHFASHFRTFSHIDLSICSPSLFPLLEWSPADSLHDSDHYPLILRWSSFGTSLCCRHPRWITSRADWPAFQDACTVTFPSIASLDVDSAVDCINSTFLSAAAVSIPRSSANLPLHPKPWWNADCKVTRAAQQRAWVLFRRLPTVPNFIAFKRAKAIARYTRCQSQRSSWREFVSSLSATAGSHIIWGKLRKVRGTYVPPLSVLVTPTSIAGGYQDICDTLGRSFYYLL